MAYDKEDWVGFSEPGWTISFRYPRTDAASRELTVDRASQHPSTQRVHVMAQDRDEIYFEVVRHSDASAYHLYAEMQERIPRQYPDVVFGPLVTGGESSVGAFSWADQERSVRFFEPTDATYLIILRPRSPVNLKILATVVMSE